MRILYIDIDTLRADHLGCYGYHRNTSPNIDRIAAGGVRFDNCMVSDAPCLPSRSALFSGRFGIHNGAINHGGVAADPFIEGPNRQFRSTLGATNWPMCFRNLGMKTISFSSFGERHSAWHFYAGWNEMHNCGKGGGELADEVTPGTVDWIRRNGRTDNWFLHYHIWDPHTPYRTPKDYPNVFKNDPIPAWYTEDIRKDHWSKPGPHSAQEVLGFGEPNPWTEQMKQRHPLQPLQIDSMDEARRMFDGYDLGIRYADDHVGRVIAALAEAGILDETVIMLSSDHGENMGELGIYGDHQTADNITSRVPMIVRMPQQKARVDSGLHYQVDVAATLVELMGGKVPGNWDGQSFAEAFKKGADAGRPYLVVSQGAWSCMRSVRFDDYICMRSYHDGYHAFPDVMLYNVKTDPHMLQDLAPTRPDLAQKAMAMLDQWHGDMMRTSTSGVDPMWTVMREGGPLHTRGHLPAYLKRLRETGRAKWADALAANHPREV